MLRQNGCKKLEEDRRPPRVTCHHPAKIEYPVIQVDHGGTTYIARINEQAFSPLFLSIASAGNQTKFMVKARHVEFGYCTGRNLRSPARTSGDEGKRVSVRVYLGGCRNFKKKKHQQNTQ